MTLNKGRNCGLIGVGLLFKICFRSNHVEEQYMFSFSPSILALIFYLIFGVIFFGSLRQKIGYVEDWGQVQIVLESTHIWGNFWVQFGFQKLLWGSLMKMNTIHFL